MADPKLSELTAEAKALNAELANTKRLLGEVTTAASRTTSSFGNLKTSLKTTADTSKETNKTLGTSPGTSRGTGLSTPSEPNTVWSKARTLVSGASVASEVRSAGGTRTQAIQSGARFINSTGGGGSGGGGGGGILSSLPIGSSGGSGGSGMAGMLSSAIGALSKAADIYGALSGAGIQMAYNRIEGPTGNRNTTLQLAQSLGPNAGMMGMSVQDLLTGLAQKTPVLGSNADIVNTILAGQSVGAFMTGQKAPAASGIPGRSGFFESVRQMQLLTPGVSAGSMATTLSNYIGNTQSQQMGQYMGQGAFTMIGKGGSYKSLAEWAEAILRFLSEQRPGGAQGSKFSKEELMSQNFPGSNINSWFKMMGVPQTMVDYWWQYALANADKTNPVSGSLLGGDFQRSQTQILQENIKQTRGMDLGYERLRSTTQGARRDYLMGTQMYGLYNVRESADRRFNVGMQAYDNTIGQLANTTNVGAAMALMPTPIMEILLPLLTKLASSKAGTALSLFGNMSSLIQGGLSSLGNLVGLGDPPVGDPPVGDYGQLGSSSTAHLSPGLAKRVNAMLSANPRLKISSGYRDTVTQNRLYKNGVGRVGPASKSAHTRGWAVDIGPTSELGWLQANAGKFGLQTASHAGEPWHIQMDGTMPVGDAMTDAISSFTGNFGGLLMDTLTGGGNSMSDILGKFITKGDLSSFIDKAISWFIKLMTAPLSGLAKTFGERTITQSDIETMVNKKGAVKVEVSKFPGFKPYSNPGYTSGAGALFGDPVSLASSQPATVSARIESPIIFKTDVHISGGASSNPIDIQKTAVSIADALEAEYAKRSWRKS